MATATKKADAKMAPRLKTRYKTEIVAGLTKEFQF